ncbi:hypothetical protein DPMN_166533 [Dreissena polymorpha]|uniref:Uncharacterized protein n=1 Tax=Dreissena polymorpha TaxID=45954 RepID=A0A9D4EYT2_DREPO|nr:hypothetical protein DPMN_166533 [Dreissena polymorpha]
MTFAFIYFYCVEKFGRFEAIIKHLNHRNQKQDIKCKQLELDSTTGLLGYRTVTRRRSTINAISVGL